MLVKHSRNLGKKIFLAQWVRNSYQLMLYNYLALRSLIFAFRATPTYIRTYANIRNYCLCSYSSSESFFQKKKKEGAHAALGPPTVPCIRAQTRFLGSRVGKYVLACEAALWVFPISFQNSVPTIFFFPHSDYTLQIVASQLFPVKSDLRPTVTK